MFDIYYAYIYNINNGSPVLLQELPLKASSLDSAWNKIIEIAFTDTKQESKKMIRIIEEENPF